MKFVVNCRERLENMVAWGFQVLGYTRFDNHILISGRCYHKKRLTQKIMGELLGIVGFVGICLMLLMIMATI